MAKDPMDILNPNTGIDNKINDIFLDKREPFATILVIPKEKYEPTYLRLIKKFSETRNIIYVSMNKEASELIEELTFEGISCDKVLFIDSVSNMVDRTTKKQNGVILVENPSEISEIGDALEKAIKKTKKGIVIIDSLSTMLVYNDPITVERFLHTTTQKIKKEKFNQILLSVETKDEKLLSTVSQFFDDIKSIKQSLF